MDLLKTALPDELTGALIGLARSTFQHVKTEQTDRLVVAGLRAGAGSTETELIELIRQIRREKELVAPGCSICTARCGNTDDYDMRRLWNADEEIRSLKSVLLLSLGRIAAEFYPLPDSGENNDEIMAFLYKALFILAEDWSREELLPVVLETGNIYQICRNLLDNAGK